MHRFGQAVVVDAESVPPVLDLVILGQADHLGVLRGGSRLVVAHGTSWLAREGRDGCTSSVWNGVSSLRMAETLYIPSRPIVPISTEAPFFIVATTDQPRDGDGDMLGRRHTLGQDEREGVA